MCEIVKHTVAASSRTLYITDGTEIEILHEVRLGNVAEQRGPETVIECLEPGADVWHPVATPAGGEALLVSAGTRLRLRAVVGPKFDHLVQGVVRDGGIAVAREHV